MKTQPEISDNVACSPDESRPMSAPPFGMVGVIFPDGAPPVDLEQRLSGIFMSTPLGQVTTWRAPGVFVVTSQHGYETDGRVGKFEQDLPRTDGLVCLVCADLTSRDRLSIDLASRRIATATPEQHGALKVLDGSWVGFAWDPARRVARFFRDAAGLRLLFVSQLPDRIVFATDTRLLVAAGVPRVFDSQAAAEYLHFFYISGPRILLRGATAVLPAHIMTMDAKGIRQSRWSPSRYVPGEPLGDPEAVEREVEKELPRFEELLLAAVRDCIPPKGRIALSLSGGKDSSTLAVALAKLCPDRVLAYTVGMKDKQHDESNDAALICKHLGIQHFVHVATDEEIAEGIRALSPSLDQPVGDLAALPYFCAMRALPDDCHVLLDGSGNDYYFGCNIAWKLKRLEQRLKIQRHLPEPLWKLLLWGMSHTTKKMNLLADTWREPIEETFVGWEGWTQEELSGLLDREVSFEDSLWWRKVRTLDLAKPVELQTEAICHVWEPSTAFRKAVHFGQSTGRIVRLPFTDQRLVTWANALPAELKYNGKINKYLMRAYMKRNLPREIVEKPKKGFIFDLNRALMNPAIPWAEAMANSGALRLAPDWSQSQVDELWRKYRRDPNDPRWQARVYSLCMLATAWNGPLESSCHLIS